MGDECKRLLHIWVANSCIGIKLGKPRSAHDTGNRHVVGCRKKQNSEVFSFFSFLKPSEEDQLSDVLTDGNYSINPFTQVQKVHSPNLREMNK